MISDVRAFLRVVAIFLPVPIFWALYDQQGSRWTDQAIQLDGRIGSFVIKPDQMQAFNPILIIILIPLFDFVVYPLFAKINIFKSLLQRMFVGLCLAAFAFFISAFLEYKMQQALTVNNPVNNIRILNLLPCSMDVYDQNSTDPFVHISQVDYLNNRAVDLPKSLLNSISKEGSRQLSIKYSCSNGFNPQNEVLNVTSQNLPNTLLFYTNNNNQTLHMELPYNNENGKVGFSQVMFKTLNTDAFGTITPELSELGVTENDFQVDLQ